MGRGDGTLELSGLRRTYGEVVALDGPSFTVPRGQVFGFLGPNGAGKTTTMRAIVGVASLDSGTVRWGGEPIGTEARSRYTSSVNPFYHVLGFIPFTAPVTMPVLVAVGAAPAWQEVIAVVITLGATVGMVRLAALIYERAILRTGNRLKVRQVLRTR